MADQERETHLSFMREALAMAERALLTGETPVGCVLVHDSRIIGRGMNATNRTYNGTRHAEFIAIDEVLTTLDDEDEDGDEDGGGDRDGEKKGPRRRRRYGPEVLRECVLYVTVEPCIMCASLLRQFGIAKVFFGASNEKFGGTGGVLSIHSRNGRGSDVEEEMGVRIGGGGGDSDWERERDEDYEVSGGWLREEAILLLRRFYVQENERAPEPKMRGKEGRVLKVDFEQMS